MLYLVKRSGLWQIMSEHGFPAKVIRLIRTTLDGFIGIEIESTSEEGAFYNDGH